MQYRTLGRTGIEVSEIGFGAWGIGGWGKRDDDEAVRALQHAFDQGITFYDTAMAYGDGHSEILIAKALRKKRENVVIATKVSPKTGRWPATPRDPIHDVFPKDWIIECTEASLKRLKTDYIDVQQLHTWTPHYVDESPWHEAFEQLKDEGKIRAYGVSSNDWDAYGPTELVEAEKIDSVQVIYNIFEQRPEEELLPAAQQHNVGIICRVPFEEGLLTGALTPEPDLPEDDWRLEWLTPERLDEVTPRVEALKQFLGEDCPTLAVLALKFCLSHPAISTVIPGMRRTERVDENVRASNGKPLPPETVKALHKHAFVHGWQYPWIE